MSEAYLDTERRMAEAVSAWNLDTSRSIRAIAREFNVGRSAFTNRLHGTGSQSTRPPANKILTDAQEHAICHYIERLNWCGQSPKLSMVEGAANYLLKQAHLDPSVPPPKVGDKWTKRFVDRHPLYFKRKQKPLPAEKDNAHNVDTITKHFEAYQTVRIERGIADEDTWNMDETRFRIGCGRCHWVVSTHRQQALRLVDPDNRDYISSCECISAGGRTTLSMLILSGKQIKVKWALENDLDDEILLATSELGYSNDELAIQWLVHFEKHSRVGQVGAWRLLILDGYGSHLTFEFFTFAQEHKIELFRLPLYSTHLTQPLDVGCFQPYKHYHAEALDDAVRAGGVDFDKLDFLSIFQHMRNQTFTKSTILSSFKKTGLVPYDLNMVLHKITAIQDSRRRQATPPPSLEPEWYARTPRTSKELVDFGLGLHKALKDNHAVKKPFQKHLSRLVKGALASAHALEISDRDLELIHRTAVSKAARKKLDGRVAQVGGVISVRDVRAKASKHEEDELAKATRVYEKALGAEQKRQQAGLNAEKKIWKDLFAEARLYIAARKKREVDRRKRARVIKRSIGCRK